MSDATQLKPRLRPVEAFALERDGRRWIVLQDPSGLAPAQVALSPHAFFIVSQFEGNHTIPQIQAAFVRQFGQIIMGHQVADLIRQLDDALLLDSPRFAERYRACVAAYLAGDSRPMRDGSLPPRPVLDELMKQIVQPKEPPSAPPPPAHGRLAGLIAPHLDYSRGLPCYAAAYGALGRYAAGRAPPLVVILGVNHFASTPGPVACDKDYLTPYGRVPADREAIGLIGDWCERDLLASQYDHAREHSVELHATVLAHLFGEGRFRMVGLLLPDACDAGSLAGLDLLAEAFARLIEHRNGAVLLVAGADLSHVGPRFGDDRSLDPQWLAEVARVDRRLVGRLEAGGVEAFAEQLAASGNATRICSSGPLYVLRRTLRAATWQDLGYHQATDAKAGTCVTCTGAALWQ